MQCHVTLTHWGRVTHTCVGKLTIIDSDNGLSPGGHQAIIWTNAGILLIGPLGTNFNYILIGIETFSFKKMHLKMLFVKWHPFCLGFNVLTYFVMKFEMRVSGLNAGWVIQTILWLLMAWLLKQTGLWVWGGGGVWDVWGSQTDWGRWWG